MKQVQELINDYLPYAEEEVSSQYLEDMVLKLYTNLCKEPHISGKSTTATELRCLYHNKKPASFLKPVAMEILSVEPRIVMFYDVISAKESKELIELATPLVSK